jgi:hypothetical protein
VSAPFTYAVIVTVLPKPRSGSFLMDTFLSSLHAGHLMPLRYEMPEPVLLLQWG